MASHICKSCGTRQARPHFESPSSFVAELLVWLVAVIFAAAVHWIALLAAFGFSLWRYGARRPGRCPTCNSADVIPISSPLGKELAQQIGTAQPDAAPAREKFWPWQ